MSTRHGRARGSRGKRRPRPLGLRSLTALLATAVLPLVALGLGAAPAQATGYPVPYSFAAGISAELLNPGSAPPGANNWSCRPSAAHPRPVVLVHGTFGDLTDSWQALSPLLADQGYCVFALNYGGSPGNLFQGYGDIPTSAAQLAAFVDQVLAATGAAQADIVGHSQGGMMPRYYLKNLGGAAKVHTLVGLAPSNHGTNLDGLTGLLAAFPGGSSFVGSLCAACGQQTAGSPFITALNSGGDTVPGIHYTVIETRYDEVVTPYSSAFLSGADVTDITLQDQCGLDLADHLAVIYDPVALHDVLNALDPAHASPPLCVPVLPVLGG
ncbi:triacylglycerol esterase/lipase EstA (alpha/beta hydrolase family) [Streptacidiphilus sp. MAP12-16]|uniref:esterase/lipase family protein n=1 Tax=Streptacidiphilus sp. MAP12-16 TaxID=3156300 RepID=UPI0035158528